MKTTKTNKNNICKNCNAKLDAGTSLQNHQPKEGDISICIYCLTITTFDSDLNLIPMSKAQLDELKKESPMSYESILQNIRLIKMSRRP